MTRKRLLLILACFAAMLMAGYVTLRLTAPGRHQITEENCKAIQIGMTEEEVNAILGVESGDYSTGAYKEDTAYKLLIRQGSGKAWIADDAAIRVSFNEAGKVAAICFTSGPGEPNTFLNKVRRWLGMQ